MKIAIPELSLVVLVGASGCGKSTFARRHFRATEVLSSDHYRGVVSDDENSQEATSDAFEVLHFVAGKRLAAMRLTVVDATNVRPEDRAGLVALARKHHVLPVAIVLDIDERICHERNTARPDRQFGPHVVRNQMRALRKGMRGLKREGFRQIHVLDSLEKVEAASIERQRLWTDKRDDVGPFDIIGDMHGCCDELEALLAKLGYAVAFEGQGEARRARVMPPPGRRALFVGDLVDRGPRVADALRIAMDMVEGGQALCVLGNHEAKVERWLGGRDVKMTHGLAETAAQFEAEPPAFRERAARFIGGLVSHYVLDAGKLVVAHAGLKEALQGRASGAVRSFALYGETTGETDDFGLPVRYDWALDYRGKARVVYGHTPVPQSDWLNGTICLDTGCVFGGKLTALRYPEMELVDVPAARTYFEPVRPLAPAPEAAAADRLARDTLDLADLLEKRVIDTSLGLRVTVRAENAAAALEAMSRFALNPKWLIHLPPTMSPCATASDGALLEHPAQAFDYFRREGIRELVCEEKHMGSRALALVCRGAEAARRRFDVHTGETGVIFTRTGRRFFGDADTTEAVLDGICRAADAAGLWTMLETDWILLDAELMPWSAKAGALIADQYAPTAAAGQLGLRTALRALEAAGARGVDTGAWTDIVRARAARIDAYASAYRGYCWPVRSVADLKLAPFHLLASESAVHMDKTHRWHLETLAPLAEVGGVVTATAHRFVDIEDAASVEAATRWWLELTGRGGEGMVVKPLQFVVRGKRGLIQPALKVRGPEYLRIIYGPDYDAPGNIERLRSRALGAKRSLAIRELALGHEALTRFVNREPLRRVHECVFGVLALESEPVDPRL